MNLEQAARLRQGVYRLTAAGFAYPRSSLIETASGALDALDAQGLFEFSFALDVAEAIDALRSSRLEEMEVAYVALFEAGVGGSACPPHESAHLADTRLGEVAVVQSELRRAYLRFGLSLDQAAPDMVDHAATELDVMALLCSREATTWAADELPSRVVQHQRELLEDHLLRWLPGFATQVAEANRHPAYTSLAGALGAFLEHERQWVHRLVVVAEKV